MTISTMRSLITTALVLRLAVPVQPLLVAQARDTPPPFAPDTMLPGVMNAAENYIGVSAYATARAMPRFTEYSTTDTLVRAPARVDLTSHPAARRYQTVLEAGARQGPNFAGHFTVVTWGCGSPCTRLAIIDARTGRVWVTRRWFGRPPLFRRDSRLLIHDPSWAQLDANGSPVFGPVEYFVWTGQRLRRRATLTM